MVLIIILMFIWVSISYLLAGEFMEIASQKGYCNRKYFWYCFLFGLAGYLIVIALPTKIESFQKKDFGAEKDNTSGEFTDNKKYVGSFPEYHFSDKDGLKQCPNCGTCHDSVVAICPACKYVYNK